MEQKKILWIVAALGVFLLVIFLGTLIIYSPQQSESPAMMSSDINNDTWINPEAIALTQATQAPAEQVTTSSNAQNIVQDQLVQTGDVTVISQGKTTVYSQDGVTTIDLKAIQEETAESVKQDEASVRPVTTRLPQSTVTEQKVVTQKEETPAPAKVEAVKPATPQTPVGQYWVQAASFVSKANADKARSSLVAQKIPAEVFTHADKEGVTFYRVRVGPYTTKSEAEYWNSLIKTVENFTDAKSYVTKTANPAQ